jgi:glycerophosphoryl diester phosphodiesterase
MPQPLRIGHRGAAGHAPENTLLSIEAALAIGVDVVEIDVHRSLDGHLIVMHDERVDRTTNGSGYIRDLTLAELRDL